MRTTLAALLFILFAFSASAQPIITDINPQEGFTYGHTHVTITGFGFDAGQVEVFFDDVKATVFFVTANMIRVRVPPAAEGAADVTVRVAGQGEAKLTNAFFFHLLAQGSPEDYMPVIVPLTPLEFKGSHGSVWTSELRVYNAGALTLRMPGPEAVFMEIPFDPAIVIEPNQTERVILNRRANQVDGAFLYVPIPLVGSPKFSLRIRDTSKNAVSAGTDFPVAWGNQAAPDITLIDIPTDPRYRATLRVYGFTAAPMRVGVKIYPEDGMVPIDQFDVDLLGIVTTEFVPFPPHPAYFVLDPITDAVRASGNERIRIELTNYGANVSPPPPNIWGFVSITNNETQQVTAVTPK
ncbi:MAG TPA: IPT/TIG domain-containing protein [Thermoanaerobaculia bacterium]|nr:IPT/TIG domain-containing protein [Thermoanaerobaculia bacterium]